MRSSAASTRKIRTTIIFPSPGKITMLLTPAGPGIRRDSGVYEGWTVPIDYDPLLAKLIGYGENRAAGDFPAGARACRNTSWAASRRTLGCSGEFWLMRTSRPGKIDTGYLERLLTARDWWRRASKRTADIAAIAAAVFAMLDSTSRSRDNDGVTRRCRTWRHRSGTELRGLRD